jgi:hypothetical protein
MPYQPPPDREHPPEPGWVRVGSAANIAEAALMVAMLRGQEIRAFYRQESAGVHIGLSVGLLSAIDIMVFADDLDRARDVLDAFSEGGQGPEEPGE